MTDITDSMLLDSARPGHFPDEGWVMEPKLDGWRFTFHVDENRETVAYTRARNASYTGGMPDITDRMSELFPANSVIDAEVIPSGRDGVSTDVSTALAVGRPGMLLAAVFDVMQLDGIDTRRLPWHQRRWCLEQILAPPANQGTVRLVPVTTPSKTVFESWMEMKMEGAVLKQINSTYQSGRRSSNWLKMKPQRSADCEIVGLPHDGQGKYEGLVGAVEFDFQGRTCRASGMTDAVRQEMTHFPERYLGHIAEFAYQQVTRDGFLRHPQFRRLRPDKEDR